MAEEPPRGSYAMNYVCMFVYMHYSSEDVNRKKHKQTHNTAQTAQKFVPLGLMSSENALL